MYPPPSEGGLHVFGEEHSPGIKENDIMWAIKKVGMGMALAACFAMLSSSVMARGWGRLIQEKLIVARDISGGGNLSTPHLLMAKAIVNPKNGSVVLWGRRGGIRNSSGKRACFRMVPGPTFGLPSWMTALFYKVSNNKQGSINSHNDTASIFAAGRP